MTLYRCGCGRTTTTPPVVSSCDRCWISEAFDAVAQRLRLHRARGHWAQERCVDDARRRLGAA